MNVRIDYCSYYSCAVDIDGWRETPPHVDYQYFNDLDALKKKLENEQDRVWLPKIEHFERWLKNYIVIADLGYLVKECERKIERIINVHIYYSVWLKRPLLRVSDIGEFTIEVEEEED